MQSASNQNTEETLLTLKEASDSLNVSIDTLLEWNDNNILKPIITLNGEVGYKSGQIDKFLKIQEQLMVTHQTEIIQSATDAIPPAPEEFSTLPEISNQAVSENKEITPKNKFGRISNFAGITGIVLTVIAVTSIFTNNQKANYSSLETTDGGVTFSKPQGSLREFSINSGTENIDSEGNLADSNKTFAGGNLLSSIVFPGNDSHNDQGSRSNSDENLKPNVPYSSGTLDRSLENYSQRTNCPDCVNNSQDSIFDENGNIKGDPQNPDDRLSSVLGIGQSTYSRNSDKNLSNTAVTLIFLGMALTSVLIIAKTQQSFQSTVGKDVSLPASDGHSIDSRSNNLELTQKTDGTVILNINGTECKISKPEFNSESDQFIERLLELTDAGIKEYNYDILKDEKLKLNAPLSKLVTRLGFVGLKRDLFFPRTSKNSVLFRRYITREDLSSMGFTPDQITNSLMN